MKIEVEQNKDRILSLLAAVYREEMDDFLAWLEGTDFFTAPASTMHHLHEEGGLAQHSLDVYDRIKDDPEVPLSTESKIIVGLLHDICKVGLYTVNMIKDGTKKNPDGSPKLKRSDAKPYVVKDDFPIGHGGKSAYMIRDHGLHLTQQEVVWIWWHMADKEHIYTYSKMTGAISKVEPRAIFLHFADYKASVMEGGEEE